MIPIDFNSEVKLTPSIKVSTPNDKQTLSFGELLKGTNIKDDSKLLQKGVVVLSLDGNEKNLKNLDKEDKKLDGMLSLLQNDDVKSKETLIGLNSKITQELTQKEVKYLIRDAKKYLREQIIQSDGYKQAQIKELPQTLKGLASLANKFDIDISKITIEQVQVKSNDRTSPLEVKSKEQLKPNDRALSLEVKSKEQTKINNLENTIDIKINEKKVNIKADARIDQKVNEKVQNDLKQIPIFRMQSRTEAITTEQIVLVKQFQPQEIKTPKQRADNTLKLLLRGDKGSKTSANLTSDFSVATAKLIAPSLTNEINTSRSHQTKSLESLLRGESNVQNTDVDKAQQLNIHKADSFEVKLGEAKQMIKYLSSDVKAAIQDYKSPFTRIRVQLNPQNLGAIDLTVVQRGKNLHVNLTSNNVAINALALNVNDLKTQLVNNGINNATFNFNSASENSSSNNAQQQNFQNKQDRANEEYIYFDNEEQNEEILSSLEIIVPSYA